MKDITLRLPGNNPDQSANTEACVLNGDRDSVKEVDASDLHDVSFTNSHSDSVHDNRVGSSATESDTTSENKRNSQTTSCSTDSSEPNSTERIPEHSTLSYNCDVNKDNSEVICNGSNGETALPGDASDDSKHSVDIRVPLLGSKEAKQDGCDANKVNVSELDNVYKEKVIVYSKDNKDISDKLKRRQSCFDDPPDGGWGWVVTFSAFMVGVILDGISFSFGLFFKELYVYFNESKSLTSWIISVLNGTYLGIGKLQNI